MEKRKGETDKERRKRDKKLKISNEPMGKRESVKVIPNKK